MRNSIRAWLAAIGVLLVFVVAALALPSLLGLAAKRALIFRVALLLLGLVAGVLTLLLMLRRSQASPAPAVAGSDDIDLAFADAQVRLRGSSAAAESRISRLPLVLVLGPQGATKSSIVTHSGIDADLLHGEVFRGDVVMPTDPVNVWYAQGVVLVEAGGKLLDDQTRWTRLLAHLRASRLAAAIGRGHQAPRAAVVCFACDELVKPGASESVAAAARRLRGRLSEVSQQLGIRLPVYVLFTRADRVAGFTEYVRNFTTDEAQQVLGATLPLAAEGDAGWAESQARRLQAAFGRIVHALGAARLDVLEREAQDPARAAAYEFPRELSKISELAVQFLVDVCRPSQLGVNPFLRGFYFVGVRPVIVRDAAVEAPAPRVAAAPAADATAVFNPGAAFARGPVAVAQPVGGRKVPQWTFLRRLFPEVVFADGTALKVTSSGTRVDLLRRGLIAAAAAALVIVSLGMTVSFARNRSMVRQAMAAATQAREVGGVAGIVGLGDLERLEGLRVRAGQVLDYEQNGHPLSLAWGLYVGHRLAPLLRRVYFDRFGRALWNETQSNLLAYLRGLPEQPTEDSDFGRVQDALAAHLLTTTEFRRATPELLAPALMSHARDLGTDSARALAQRQFTFFATELPRGNLYQTSVDAALVERTQRFLRAFGKEAYYRALVYEGNRSAAKVSFPGSATVVQNDVVVPGAFTPGGRRSVEAQLDSVDQLFVRYQWIYGSQPPAEKPQREDLRRTYEAEYVRRWQDYLAGGSVARFSSPSDAATKLAVLGAPTSPLFGMLAVASQNTPDDSTSVVGRAFQPLHIVVPSTVDPRGTTASARSYANALTALGSQMNLLATATGAARQQTISAATAAATDVTREAATLTAAFAMTGDATVTASRVKRLLQQPAEYAQALLGALPIADLNAAGRSFCGSFDPAMRKFPFNSRATSDASVDEVNALFAKDDGLLWTFFNDQLKSLLTPQGRPLPGARVSGEFVRFFGHAADVTTSLYHNGPISVAFNFRPSIPAGASSVILSVDGDQASFTPQSRASRQFLWTAAQARSARLTVVYGAERVDVAAGSGPWAPLRVMYAARWSGSGPYDLEWPIPGRNASLSGTISVESGVGPVFKPGYLGQAASCTSQIAY